MKLSLSHTHQPNGDIWNPHCRVCGTALLDGGVTPAQLCERVTAAFQQTINPTGRQRGTWIEIEEVLDDECWMWWVRPASNLLGFEAVEHPSSNPTGEELSMAFLAEMLTAPAVPVEVHEIASPVSRRKPTRRERLMARYRVWRDGSELREFVSIALPITCVEFVAVGWILGWDGMSALAGLLVGWMF